MYINKVEICGVNTSKLTVLKEKEKIELLKRIRAGDQAARDEMINGNLRLVLSVVQKFTNRGENLDDLFQVGCIGLIKAIDNFDPNQNVRFSTYGVPMIIGEIRRHLRDNNAVRVSRSLRDMAYKAMQAKEALMNRNSREPTVDEIAKEMGVKKEDVVLALEAIVEPMSLYEPVYSDGGDTIFVMNGKKRFCPCAFLSAKHRWRLQRRLGFPKRRYRGWKKAHWNGSKSIFEVHRPILPIPHCHSKLEMTK